MIVEVALGTEDVMATTPPACHGDTPAGVCLRDIRRCRAVLIKHLARMGEQLSFLTEDTTEVLWIVNAALPGA